MSAMQRVYNPYDKPFIFAFGGKTWCVPPKDGGTWVMETVPTQFEQQLRSGQTVKVTGSKAQPKFLKATPKRNWIDVPGDAVARLNQGDLKKRQRDELGGLLKFSADIQKDADVLTLDAQAELDRLQADIDRLKAQREELAKLEAPKGVASGGSAKK